MSDKIKPKNPLLEDLENKEIVPTGTTDKLIFRGNNPFNVWRGSQYLTPQYTPGRDYIAYSNGENIWRVPLEKIYPINDDDLTPQQRLERDWRKSPAYSIDKVILGTLAGTMAPFAVAEADPLYLEAWEHITFLVTMVMQRHCRNGIILRMILISTMQ